MSEKIDWSKAPEGATHYNTETEGWYKQGVYAYRWDGCKWYFVCVDLGQIKFSDNLIERPTTTSWSGEGLPPVGVVCMANGYQVVIVAHHCNGIHAIYAESEYDGLLYYGEPNEFRPIRTPEQVAADEREAAVKDMMSHIYACLPRECWDESGLACFTLYDAGYRKP